MAENITVGFYFLIFLLNCLEMVCAWSKGYPILLAIIKQKKIMPLLKNSKAVSHVSLPHDMLTLFP